MTMSGEIFLEVVRSYRRRPGGKRVPSAVGHPIDGCPRFTRVERKTMRTTTKMWGAAAMLTLAVSGAFAPVQAQSATADAKAEITRAEVLSEYGRQLAHLERDFRKASLLLREAAELRGNAPEAVDELVEAGHFAYYGGLKTAAIHTLYKAGRVALQTGDAATAAEAFLDGAWVAHELGDDETARELLVAGQSLATSAAIEPQDRDALLTRIGALR
jgi:hypothetical protein